MMQEALGWTLGMGSLVALAAAYVFPTTRPYVKKYGWTIVIVLVVAGGLILLRRKPGRDPLQEARDEGDQQLAANLGVLDDLVDSIEEKRLDADVELSRRLIEDEKGRQEFDIQRMTIASIDDSLERRKALIKLVEGKA